MSAGVPHLRDAMQCQVGNCHIEITCAASSTKSMVTSAAGSFLGAVKQRVRDTGRR